MPMPVSATSSSDVRPPAELAPSAVRVEPDVGASSNRESPAVRHRVARVDGEIHDDLLDLAAIAQDRCQRRRRRSATMSMCSPMTRRSIGSEIGDRAAIRLIGRRLQHLPAAEREQLAGQAGGALGRLLDLRDLRRGAGSSGEVVAEPVGVAEDRGEQVVEVVRDAAGELADRLHLLALSQAVLEIAPLGDVARDGDEPVEIVRRRSASGRIDGRADERARRRAAGTARRARRARARRASSSSAAKLDLRQVEERRRRLDRRISSLRIAEHVLGAGLPGDDARRDHRARTSRSP